MFTKEQTELIKAFLDGKEVQMRSKYSTVAQWLDKKRYGANLVFDFREFDYRMKPKESFLIVIAYKKEVGQIETTHLERSSRELAERSLGLLMKEGSVIAGWITKL